MANIVAPKKSAGLLLAKTEPIESPGGYTLLQVSL